MSSKVILFCVLFFGPKFVALIPFDEELGQQRALLSNSWQGNINTAEQYHGSDSTRAHSINAMTNSAQQYPTDREFETNRRRQHNENYENNFPHPLHSLPTISNPVNVAPGNANEHRRDDFVSRVDSYPIRSQHHPIRVDNQFKQQNWQIHSRFENPTMGAVNNIAAHESPLAVHKPYLHSGQAVQPPPVNRQYYQGDNLYPKDIRYHPVPQASGSNRYIDYSTHNSKTHTRPVHYESYHEAQEHNTNIAQPKHNIYVEKVPVLSRSHNPHVFENHNQPGLKTLYGPRSYIAPPESNNNKNIHIAPINTEINKNPPAPHYLPMNPRHSEQPLHIQPLHYRHMENPIIHSEPNNNAHDTYYPAVPLDAVLDESANTRQFHKQVITKEPNNYAPLNTFNINPIIQKDSALSNTASNDNIILNLANNDGPSGTTADDKKTNIYSNFPEENPSENIYDFSKGENVKEYFLDKIKNNFVILYENGTVEYVKHLDTDDNPDFIVVNKPLVESSHVTSDSTPGSKQPTSNILESLPDKINDYDSSVTSIDNNYNKPLHDENANNSPLLLQPLNDNHDNNSLLVPELQQSLDTTPLPFLESTVFNENPQTRSLDNYDPVLGTLHGNNYNWDSKPPENRQPYNSNKNNGYPGWKSKLLKPTSIHTSTTPASDDAMIQDFLDSLSIKSDREQQLSDSNYYSPQGENTSNHNNNHPIGHAPTTILPSQLHTVISPGISSSTTLDPDNSEIQKHQDSDSLMTVSSSIIPPSKYEESFQGKTTPFPSSSDSESNPNTTPEDQIITISPIELVTDYVKDGSSPTSEDKEPLEVESAYAKKKLDDSDHDSKSDDITTSLPSNTHNLHNTESIDNVLTQVINRVEIAENSTKSACNDSLANTCDPEQYDDNTAAPTNQKDVNTDKVTGYNSFELKPPKSGLEIKLNIPNDSEGTLYIKVDAPDGYTGNEVTSSNDTLLVSITRQNNSDIDLITVKNDSDGHDYFNTAVTDSDEENPTKNMKLDLSNALVVMNGTTDKEYLNQLLSSDSKVNLFIFQMPCQDQAIVEKSKETTIYPNGTCIELSTETRWKNKDDPSPVIITMKKIYGGGKCN